MTDTPLVLLQLKNMPVLKKLTLETPTMTLYNLEKIHSNVPSIQELYLISIKLNARRRNPPLDISPAPCVKIFSFRGGKFQNRTLHARFYQYMAKKYTNSTTTEYADRQLSEYGFRTDQSTQLYLNGVIDFFKLIGPRKSYLNIYGLPDHVDPFEALDSVGSRIKKMYLDKCQVGTIFQHLSQSDQANHLQELNVYSKTVGVIHPLASLTALTTLNLHITIGDVQPVQFVDILAACPPSLKTLDVDFTPLEYGPFTTKLGNLEVLKIRCKMLSKHLGDVISTCFPNLVSLDIFGTVPHAINITLESPRFQKAVFKTSGFTMENRPAYGFSFKSPNYTKPQYYSCRKNKKNRVQLQQSLPKLRILSVESLTEKNLQVTDGSIYISSR